MPHKRVLNLFIEPEDKAYKGDIIAKCLAQCKEIDDKAYGSSILIIYLTFNDITYWTYYKHILDAYANNAPIKCYPCKPKGV